MNRLPGAALAVVLCLFGLSTAQAGLPLGEADSASVGRAEAWSDEIVDMAARLPVLEQGRIKPLSTVAAFALLRMHHTRKCTDANGDKLDPTEWMLDTLFYPDLTATYQLFRVQTNEVLQAIGVSSEGKKKRDLYSYKELLPGRERLAGLANSYATIEAGDRTMIQGQILNLARNVSEFERFQHFLDFTRARIKVEGVLPFAKEEGGASTRSFSEVVAAGADVAMAQANGEQESNEATGKLLTEAARLADSSMPVRLIPPTLTVEERPEWTSPGELMADAFLVGAVDPKHVAMVAALEGMAESRDDSAAFLGHLKTFDTNTRELAAARDEGGKVDLEVTYYKMDFFTNSLVFYLLAFVVVAISWTRRGGKGKLFKSAQLLTGIGASIHIAGIVTRCILRSRPPISTLYETVIFVAVTAVVVSLIIELIDRRRMAGAVAPFLGALGLFIAMRFEGLKGEDTMPQLIAVLDTNFWLAIHVTCITMGYSAALLASAFAHLYVLGKVFGYRKDDRAMYRGLGKTVYGTLCFALILSVAGTILGGIWANDSWGRFWGWDPKENGALMIVLAQLAILHGRLGGMLKTFGVCVAMIAQGIVVAFSWWGVNLLGVGLHSYGFTDGINSALNLFYAVEGAVILMGIAWWFLQGRHKGTAPAA